MSKFSPGPWKAHTFVDRFGELTSIVSKNGHDIGAARVIADARLIAAAPEMYAMIRDLYVSWDCDGDTHRHSTTCRSCAAKAMLASIDGDGDPDVK